MGLIKQNPLGEKFVLLVEDDVNVRRSVNVILVHYGYSVLQADSAESAIVLWEEHSQHIGLLLTDIRMPGKTGLELASILREKEPKLRVLLISGYSPDLTENMEEILGSMFFLQKPFSIKGLLEIIHEATDCSCPSGK